MKGSKASRSTSTRRRSASRAGMTARQRERFARQIRATRERLRPQLPDVAVDDLDLILERMLRPWGTGQRFFIRPNPEADGFVF